uniref:Uncharacterized protein n=1 Tax=Ditylenchus dipsaci TaxID=166011 RepID=A0A915DN39_9BILA
MWYFVRSEQLFQQYMDSIDHVLFIGVDFNTDTGSVKSDYFLWPINDTDAYTNKRDSLPKYNMEIEARTKHPAIYVSAGPMSETNVSAKKTTADALENIKKNVRDMSQE